MFTLPFGLAICFLSSAYRRRGLLLLLVIFHFVTFGFLTTGLIKDPEFDPALLKERQAYFEQQKSFFEEDLLASFSIPLSWDQEKKLLTDYGKLNLVLKHRYTKNQNEKLAPYALKYLMDTGRDLPTLWNVRAARISEKIKRLEMAIQTDHPSYIQAKKSYKKLIKKYRPFAHEISLKKLDLEQTKNKLTVYEDHKHTQQYKKLVDEANLLKKEISEIREKALDLSRSLNSTKNTIESYLAKQSHYQYLKEKESWLKNEDQKMTIVLAPLFRSFHWEEDAGGSQKMNQYIPWWERTRINRKDLTSSLLFGIRVSLVVGIASVGLSLLIGIPLGTVSGYYAGTLDLVISRLVEIWEAMPTFFMLLLIVAITQTKSILLVIVVLGCFGWTTFCRFIRAEVLKQRSLPYVMACKSLGYRSFNVMFSQILPNAIAPILTLLPFSLTSVITSEAGLSFLGLGEEGSSSWGVLMDEGRNAFPSESYLLWPPALLLTVLLITIALIGDVLRDALDPKLRR
jgi:peptide/nickel transport system permease protein